MAPFKNDCGQKKEPSSGRFQKTPSKNDCGQKNPTQAVQDTKWHLFENDCGQKMFFLAAVFFIRSFLSLALFDFGFFWPQSFLKTVTKKERSKQLRQTKEKIQLHSWWITMTMAT